MRRSLALVTLLAVALLPGFSSAGTSRQTRTYVGGSTPTGFPADCRGGLVADGLGSVCFWTGKAKSVRLAITDASGLPVGAFGMVWREGDGSATPHFCGRSRSMRVKPGAWLQIYVGDAVEGALTCGRHGKVYGPATKGVVRATFTW